MPNKKDQKQEQKKNKKVATVSKRQQEIRKLTEFMIQ